MKWPKVRLMPWGDDVQPEVPRKECEPETVQRRLERMYCNVIALAVGKKALAENGDEVVVAPYIVVQFYKRLDEHAAVGADMAPAVLIRVTIPAETTDKEMRWLQEFLLNRLKKAIEEPHSKLGIELRRELAAANLRFLQLQESRPQWMSQSGMSTHNVASCYVSKE